MDSAIPKALSDVIESLGKIPGVGPRTAERYAYYLLRADRSIAEKISNSISELHDGITLCRVTYALIPAGLKYSKLYSDTTRDKQTVAVVSDAFDIMSIEKTGEYKGTYHVLGGLISPIDDVTPDQLKISELVNRVKNDKVTEIILATNASVEGESTALYIQQQLDGIKVKLTRLARGLPIGVDLEYADQITLSRAIQGRQVLS